MSWLLAPTDKQHALVSGRWRLTSEGVCSSEAVYMFPPLQQRPRLGTRGATLHKTGRIDPERGRPQKADRPPPHHSTPNNRQNTEDFFSPTLSLSTA